MKIDGFCRQDRDSKHSKTQESKTHGGETRMASAFSKNQCLRPFYGDHRLGAICSRSLQTILSIHTDIPQRYVVELNQILSLQAIIFRRTIILQICNGPIYRYISIQIYIGSQKDLHRSQKDLHQDCWWNDSPT